MPDYIPDPFTAAARAYFPRNADDIADLRSIRQRIADGEKLRVVHVDMAAGLERKEETK